MDLSWLNAIDPGLAGDGQAELAGDWQDAIGPGCMNAIELALLVRAG
jgi:hypothetical protein